MDLHDMLPADQALLCSQVLCRLAPCLSKHLYSVTPVVAQVTSLIMQLNEQLARHRVQGMRGSCSTPSAMLGFQAAAGVGTEPCLTGHLSTNQIITK